MSFYSEIAKVATDLLTEFGQKVIQTKCTDEIYNPSTGGLSSSRILGVDRIAAIFDLEAGIIKGETNINGNLVEIGDKRLLVDPSALIEVNDIFVVKGVFWTVLNVKEINPAGTTVLFDLHIRK